MADVSSILLDRVADWLTQSSLAGNDLESVVRGLCERLAAAGLPIKRVHLSFSMLHPLYDALGFTWERGGGMSVERFRTKPGDRPERFLKSPYYHLHQQQSRASAPAHRPFAAIRISGFRRPQGARRHRLHGLHPQLRDGYLARHDRLVVDRRARRLQRRHDRGAAQASRTISPSRPRWPCSAGSPATCSPPISAATPASAC